MRGSWWCGVPVLVVMTAGCLISPVMHFGGNGKSARENQLATMHENFTPAQLVVEHTWTGEVRTVHVRVYADDEYRAQNVHWQDHFAKNLDVANEVLEAAFGIHLTADYRIWNRHVPGATVDDALAALRQYDPGNGVFTVIGLTSALGLAEASFEKLGIAERGGKHMVMRGYADADERKQLAAAFTKISDDEREENLALAKRHKLATILLHELGHTYGAGHDDDSQTIMNESYSKNAAAFAPGSRATILHTLDERLGRSSSASASGATAVSASTPSAPAGTVTPAKPVGTVKLTIYLTASGVTIVDKRVVAAAALDQLLQTTFANDPGAEITIVKDASVQMGAQVVGLTDRIHAAGLKTITITNK